MRGKLLVTGILAALLVPAAPASAQRVPDLTTFLEVTRSAAFRKADRLRDAGAIVPDEPYFTDLEIHGKRNAKIMWHVLAHKGDFTIDYYRRSSMIGYTNQKPFVISGRWLERWF